MIPTWESGSKGTKSISNRDEKVDPTLLSIQKIIVLLHPEIQMRQKSKQNKITKQYYTQ
jgi:hypothetical protein